MPDWRLEIERRLSPLRLDPAREASLTTELLQHLEQHYDDLLAEGVPQESARKAALAGLDDQAVLRELRDHAAQRQSLYSGGPTSGWLDSLLQDVRYALRLLRKSPGFATVAILTMALGVGATTAIFTVVDATLLHPMSYPHPEQLVRIEDEFPGVGAHDVGMSEPEWQDLQRSGIFQYVSPTWYDDNNLTGSSRPARVSLLIVAPDYFALLGIKPQLGRAFNPEDHSPGLLPEALISDGLWQRDFGKDPHVLDKSMRLDTDLYRIVGVMPPGFQSPAATLRDRNIEVWAATSFYGPPMLDHPPRSGRNLPTAIARLKPGLTIAAAQTQVDALVASLQKQFPADYPLQSRWTIRLLPLRDSVLGNARQALILLFGAVGLVLLIGCVNIANLLLARAHARGREIAIRQALGAARTRLMQQLLTESLLLSLFGGITGLTILFCARRFLLRLVPQSLPRFSDISISWGVLFFALCASLLAGLIFGLAPALHAGGVDLIHALKQEGRGSTGSGEQARTRRVLVVTEFALSMVLMIAASLLLRSFWDLLSVRLGFNPQSVMTIRTRLPYPNNTSIDVYKSPSQQAVFFREVLRRTLTLPGVEGAAFGDLGALPLGHDRNNQNPPVPLILEGHDTQGHQPPLIDDSVVTPGYFSLMGMNLLRGCLFTDSENENTPGVVVINEAAAQTYWPNQDPLGKHLKLSRRETSWSTVVGIVADAQTESLEARVPEIYSSLYQKGAKHLAIFLRGNLDAGAIGDQVREQVQNVDPTIPVFGAQPLNETISDSLADRRFSMEIVGLFALTALLLAGLGIYGVISYIVSERTHEIGIRLALGAQSRNILRMVLRQGLGLATAGTAVGLVGALIVSRLMAGLLYGVSPTDPPTFAGVGLLLIGVALLASFIPAWRATKVDPMFALRDA